MNRKYPDKPSKALQIASQMPAGLKHHLDNEEFGIASSEVVNWLIRQPEILQSVFNHFKDRGAIIFDSKTQTWKGRDS